MARGKLDQTEIGQRAVRVAGFVIGIGEQLEVQTLLGAKLLVRLHTVDNLPPANFPPIEYDEALRILRRRSQTCPLRKLTV